MLHRLSLLGFFAVTTLTIAQPQAPAAQSQVNLPQPSSAGQPRLSGDDSGTLSKPASMEGMLLDDRYQRPLRRGYIILRPKGLGRVFSGESGPDGKFSIANIEPGEYTVEARRDSYLTANWGRRGGIRMAPVLKVYSGEQIRDVVFRLDPWGAIEGKIRFGDDGEAAMGVLVMVYRRQYTRGHLSYVPYGSAQTNDLGGYRIAGLSPGAYMVVAIYNKPVKQAPPEGEPLAAPDTELSYSTTFFASGQKLTDATPVRLNAGEREVTGIDIFLGQVQTMRVRVEVNEGCTGAPTSKAILQLYRVDENGNPVLPMNADIAGRSNVFVIRGLGPGQYMIVGSTEPPEGCKGPLRDRRVISVSDHPVDSVKLTLVPPVLSQFVVTSDASNQNEFDLSAYRLHLEPRSGLPGGNITLEPSKNRTDALVAYADSQEDYNIVVDLKPVDAFLKGPFSTSGSAKINVSTHGATVYGTVMDDHRKPIPGATVTLIPDPSRESFPFYAEAYANEQGLFGTRGVAPGKYIAIPWLDVPPCDFYNWENIQACRQIGTSVSINESEFKTLELVLNINN